MDFILYEESRPAAIRKTIEEYPVAYVPIGALEWHGEHCPLGLDGLKAAHICRVAAEKTGGVVFPTMWWGAYDTMRFPFTMDHNPKILKTIVRDSLDRLAAWGFKAIVILSGHYPPSLVKFLISESGRFNSSGKNAVSICGPETIFSTDIGYYGDHAGMWETSIMAAIKPESVDIEKMPADMNVFDRAKKLGVLGQNPNPKADAEKGKFAIEHISEKLARVVNETLEKNNADAIERIYAEYRNALNPLSPKILRVAKEAFDVKSIPELVKYLIMSLKKFK